MYWDNQYENNERLWGEKPGILALAAVEYLQKHGLAGKMQNVLDIGCGYGRDALYLVQHIGGTVLGVDISEKAIALAKRNCRDSRINFRCCGFTELEESKKYDVVFLSNFYQLLKKDERAELRRTIDKVLKPNGLLFLSTLSTRDPEHSGKGTPVPGEINSFVDNVYLHLCERSELEEDFSFFKIKELSEHEYFEPRVTGETHHHISWILVGEQG
jgi:cyclopropane fatty-acyl-phospholipid synthase-like methyltransferase